MRLVGYILMPFNIFWAAGTLIVIEGIGIIEELVCFNN